jgi:hypothetical protein
MKLIKTANGKKKLSITKKEWERIGNEQGWMKKSQFFSNYDYLEIGPTPSGEDCAQVGSEKYDYQKLGRIEGNVYADQIRRTFPNMPQNVSIFLKSFPHDFGSYYEVVIKYPVDDAAAQDFAFDVESKLPEYWDNESKTKLENLGYFKELKAI